MKKIGIITINDNNNYGNRLQNYAVQEILNKINVEPITIKNVPTLNTKYKFMLRLFKHFKSKLTSKKINNKRYECFSRFNQNINYSERYITPYTNISKKYDYFITGSDQVWNPNISRARDVDFLSFAKDNQKISFSASFGVSEIPENIKGYVNENLRKYKAISVREDAGKKIVEELTGRKDVEVLLDPTMIISVEEWNKVAKKPEQLKSNKYILNYFLGELSENRKNEIDRIAKENDCEVINILDKKSPFYSTGPSEFLYLEKNAFLVCTDSFHSSVFAILYNRPFIVFEREDKTISMNSRIETLINKFKLKNRKFEGKITKENLNHDYTEAYKILENEKEKSINFLKRALEV